MKTIQILIVMLALMQSGYSFTLDNDPSVSDGSFRAQVMETGYVDSSMLAVVQPGNETSPLKIGNKQIGPISKQYASILTFDTSEIPDDAQIVGAFLLLSGSDEDGNSLNQYVKEHVAIDFSGPVGFSGSWLLSGLDFYAPYFGRLHTAATIPFFINGLTLHADVNGNERDVNSYINKAGKTQIRLSLNENPNNELVQIIGSGFDDLGDHIALVVAWQ